jgi:hypothetical protein
MGRTTNYEELKAELNALVSDPWSLKLDALVGLTSGWDGYHAEPPSASSLSVASSFLASTQLIPTRVTASVVGGVGIMFKKYRLKAYVEVANSGSVSLLLSDGVSELHTEPVSLDDPELPNKIREFLGE